MGSMRALRYDRRYTSALGRYFSSKDRCYGSRICPYLSDLGASISLKPEEALSASSVHLQLIISIFLEVQQVGHNWMIAAINFAVETSFQALTVL